MIFIGRFSFLFQGLEGGMGWSEGETFLLASYNLVHNIR